MITDKIENAHLYAGVSEKITRALEVLKNTNFAEKENGRYDIDGDNIYYFVQRYRTEPVDKGRLEAHKKYIDIQFVAAGRETLGYCTTDNLQIEQPYDRDKDAVFFEVPKGISRISLYEGMFCILFAADAHMPGRELAGQCEVLKVVVKVRIDG
ncbi:MAG TPA: YhcH/YjgK/YiaL family protein [Sedimentisphaerales bacterium]|nr:YhcH/YjgK/YiaL family protein [Sedimentisphaerales bacterium]